METSKWIYLISIVAILVVTGLGIYWWGVIGGLFASAPVILVCALVIYYNRQVDRETFLKENGIKGEGEILEIHETGIYDDLESPQAEDIKLKLLITTPLDAPYQLKHRETIPILKMEYFAVGNKIEVMVDPNNPKNILLIY